MLRLALEKYWLKIRQASAVPSTSTMSLPLPQAISASTSPSAIPTPPELDQTLALLSSHRSVLGYILLSRGQPVSIIRHSGVVFEGENGRKYASAIAKIIEGVQSALEEVSGEVNEGVR
jgi:dynein light chain roadblock-type